MKLEENIPLLEEVLGKWKDQIGEDYAGYQNHVFRMINFCFAQNNFNTEDREKIIIAGCFHDLGIWTDRTFDYLSPSVRLAEDYLKMNGLESWIPEISSMIDTHHKLTKSEDRQNPLTEIFRKGDLVDFSLGIVKCGLPESFIRDVKKRFPNSGFHRRLVKLACGWFCRHPFDPLPVLKW